MKKLTLTVLHKLPNRVRFKVSHEIIDTKKFFETLKLGAKRRALGYNKTIKKGGTPYKVAKLLYERSALKC